MILADRGERRALGRARGSADVRLEWDEEVSALHAQIEVVRDECTLVDDGLSRNGSFVNEERCTAGAIGMGTRALRADVVVYRAAGRGRAGGDGGRR